MDKIDKFLKKLTAKERQQLKGVLELLLTGSSKTLDIKKLKGTEHIYRARTGNIRIIFQKEGKEIRLLEVSRRDENTYTKY